MIPALATLPAKTPAPLVRFTEQKKQTPPTFENKKISQVLSQKTANSNIIPIPEGWNVVSDWILASVNTVRTCQIAEGNVSIWHCTASEAQKKAVLGTVKGAKQDKPIQIAVDPNNKIYFRYLESIIKTDDSPQNTKTGRSCSNVETKTMAILPPEIATKYKIFPIVGINDLPKGFEKPTIPSGVSANTISTSVTDRGTAHEKMQLLPNVFLSTVTKGPNFAAKFPEYNGLSGLSSICNNGARTVFSNGIQIKDGRIIMRTSQ